MYILLYLVEARAPCIDVSQAAVQRGICAQTETSNPVQCPRCPRTRVRNLLLSQPISLCRTKLLFSVVLWSLRYTQACPCLLLYPSLFHTLTSTICYTPSVFFSWTLGDSFRLSFYLLHEGRDSFICFSLFPEPDAQSLAYRRCFWKCLLSYWMWFSDHPPSFLLYWSPLGFLHQVTRRHPFFSCTHTLWHSFYGGQRLWLSWGLRIVPGIGDLIFPFPDIFSLENCVCFFCSTNHVNDFWTSLAFA